MYDVIIIGKGPAGLSASIYLARANKKVLVIGKDNKIWNNNVKINNYFGTGAVTGEELMETGLKQAKDFGVKIVDSLVTKIEIDNLGFKCYFDDKIENCNKILIATGKAVSKKEITNQDDFIGRGVSFCVPCDGFFFKDKNVFIVGNTDFALEEATEMLNYTKKVSLISNGKKITFDKKLLSEKNIDFFDYKIEKIIGNNKVQGIINDKEEEINVDGIFIASGDADSNDLARMLGVSSQDNKIIVDEKMKTNLPNVFAAGDCTLGIEQITTAVCKGAIAAMTMIKEDNKK